MNTPPHFLEFDSSWFSPNLFVPPPPPPDPPPWPPYHYLSELGPLGHQLFSRCVVVVFLDQTRSWWQSLLMRSIGFEVKPATYAISSFPATFFDNTFSMSMRTLVARLTLLEKKSWPSSGLRRFFFFLSAKAFRMAIANCWASLPPLAVAHPVVFLGSDKLYDP